ncbi:hypothetical protein ES705_15971 [subsurface metagenome]
MTDVSVDLQVVGLPEGEEPVEYELVHEELYEPEASTYVGTAEEVTIYFDALPEQIPGLDLITQKVLEAVASNIIANDGVMLRLQIYRGKGAWYNSKWKVAAAIHSSPFAWAVVIPLIVVLLIVIGFAYITHQVKTMDWGEKAIFGGIGILLILILLAGAFGGKKIAEKRAAKKEAK